MYLAAVVYRYEIWQLTVGENKQLKLENKVLRAFEPKRGRKTENG
jgi:hypothetical protein